MATLAVYVQGDIYPGGSNDPAAVVAAITGSKLTTPILALLHVNCSATTCPDGNSPPDAQDGDITFNDTLIVRGGKYVGDPTWPTTVKSLRAGQVTQIFASFGGYGVPDYARIGQLIAKYGTGPTSPLYQNFACLKNALGIDGIDFDDEDSYDQDTVVQFAQMLLGLGLKVTFCPYGSQDFWSGCIEALGTSNVSWLNLQCYAGGKYNNPGDWTGMGVPVVAGVCTNCCCPTTTCTVQQVQDVYTLWTTGQGSASSDCWQGTSTGAVTLAGGFIWTYADIASDVNGYVNAMDAGLQAGAGAPSPA
ncbi:MAG TPA: hypothetical protein VFJ16_03395 [Longimicrobium sp.]|nr:hypothetical protein [Longimicrobium sp.]